MKSPQKSRMMSILPPQKYINSKSTKKLYLRSKMRYQIPNIDKSQLENLDNLVDTMSFSATSSSSLSSSGMSHFHNLISPIVPHKISHDTNNNSLPSPSNNLFLPTRTTMRKELLTFSNQITTQSYSHNQPFCIPMTFSRTNSTNSQTCNIMNNVLCNLPNYRSHYASRVSYPDSNYMSEPLDTNPIQELILPPSNALLAPSRTQMRK